MTGECTVWCQVAKAQSSTFEHLLIACLISIDPTTHITVSHTTQIRSSVVRCSCVRSEKQLKRRNCPGPRVHRLGPPWTPWDRVARMKPQKKIRRMAHDHTTCRRFISYGSGRPYEADTCSAEFSFTRSICGQLWTDGSSMSSTFELLAFCFLQHWRQLWHKAGSKAQK